MNIFDGASNRITFEQVYSKKFKCEYKLDLYPFDTQVRVLDQPKQSSNSVCSVLDLNEANNDYGSCSGLLRPTGGPTSGKVTFDYNHNSHRGYF